MLDWVATQTGVLLDGPRDPRVGMAGGSYGGGIQLIAAAIDCRVDAITPTIAWHSLTTSLYKAETPKNGWSGLLTTVTKGRSVDPHIPHAYQASITTEILDADDRAWFAGRGPGDLVKQINVPTLIVQARSTISSPSTRASPTTGSCATAAYRRQWCGSAVGTACASRTRATRRASGTP
jgi:ABC-2 type transport system ATP-binding protein